MSPLQINTIASSTCHLSQEGEKGVPANLCPQCSQDQATLSLKTWFLEQPSRNGLRNQKAIEGRHIN